VNNFLDKLQQAWQSQCSKPIDVNPDQLLKTARLERRVYLWVDILLIAFFSFFMLFMSQVAFKKDIHEGWPWLISSASSAWVVGYILFNRWRQRRHVPHYDESVLAHVEWSIKDIEHRMQLERTQSWWYILPIALGCMIPPVLLFAMEDGKRPLRDSLIPLLGSEVVFVGTFVFVYLVMKHGGRIANEKHRQELQALRTLRETLLNTEE
jgi:hypothetical protein